MAVTKVGVISLGCDKNRVDTEDILTALARRGYEFTGESAEADVILVNTCAFLESAREEAVDTILDAAAYKRANCRCLVVAGCLPMRYLSELKEAMPEVDIWLLPDRYGRAGEILDHFLHIESPVRFVPSRLLTTPEHYAYLKIADGCDNRCTYCMIPGIRGKYISSSPEKLLSEAESLAQGGVGELILVAQDTTRYGTDRPEYGTLAALVERLSKVNGIETVRLLYCYPECITDELIDVVANNPKVAKYLDVPFQHVDDEVLKRMNRRSTYASTASLVEKLRARIPGLTLRTTFMVGFPGETEQAVDRLCEFLRTYRIEHVGFFSYSLESDTPSARMEGQLPERVKQERLERVADIQREIAFAAAHSRIGTTVNVMYEGIDYERNLFIGRPRSSAPDVDPVVYFKADFADIGNRYDVRITNTDGYDLVGSVSPSEDEV